MFLADNDLIITPDEAKLLRSKKANPEHFITWAKTKFDNDTEILRVVAKGMNIVNGNIVFEEDVVFEV